MKAKSLATCGINLTCLATELEKEIQSGVQFYGCKENGVLTVVMGIQPVKGVTLIRHAYVLHSWQRKGLGQKLLKHLLSLAITPLVYVGTWEAAIWAVKFYEKNGFQLVPECGKEQAFEEVLGYFGAAG